MGYTGHGKSEEECGGGRARPAGRAERWQGQSAEADGEAAAGERAQGGGGALVGEEILKIVLAYARAVTHTIKMKRGDIVRYSKPVSDEQARFRFILLNEPEKGARGYPAHLRGPDQTD